MKDNIINVRFGASDKITIKPLYQWDKGQHLSFGDDLPAGTEAQFATGTDTETTNRVILDNVVRVPDKMLEGAHTIYAYVKVFKSNGETTVKTVVIPVTERTKPAGYIAPDDEQDFREAIAGLMNEAVDTAKSVREDADAGKFDGKDGYTPVKGYDYFTEDEKSEVINAAVQSAAPYAQKAERARNEAEGFARSAGESEKSAKNSKEAAEEAERKTAEHMETVEASKKAVEAAKTIAVESATTSTNKASEASQSATSANESKVAAETSATNAAASAESAAQSASEVPSLKAELSDMEKQLAESNRKQDALWQLANKQIYHIEEQAESGMNDAPKGAAFMDVLRVEGKTEQKQYNGYQLIDFAKITLSNPLNMSLVVDGDKIKLTSSGRSFTYGYIDIADVAIGKDVCLSISDMSGDGTFAYRVRYIVDGVTNYIQYPILKAARIPENASLCHLQFYANNTSNTGPFYAIFDKPMIEIGTVAHDYEPFVGNAPSPSPEYPQNIVSVDSFDVRVTGKNLWDEVVELGGINSTTGANSGSTATMRFANYVPISDSKVYRFVAPEILKMANIRTRFYDENKTYIGYKDKLGHPCNYKASFQPPIGARYLRVELQEEYTSEYGKAYNHDIALIYDGEEYVYEPYVESVRTIVPPRPLNAIGEYKDVCDVVNGVWRYETGEYTFGGNEKWTIAGDGAKYIESANTITGFRFGRDLTKIECICDKFIAQRLDGVKRGAVPLIGIQDANNTRFWLSPVSDEADTIGANVVVLRSEPAYEPISNSDLAFLRSIKYDGRWKHISVTDQNGRDVSYLLRYIINNAEVLA